MGLKSSEYDPCIFYRKEPFTIIAIYVDDGVVFALERKHIDEILQRLLIEFEMHISDATTFLGFQNQKYENGDIALYQEA